MTFPNPATLAASAVATPHTVTIFSASDHGHRRDYRTVLTALFDAGAPCRVTRDLRRALVSRRAFFDMLDDRALAFLAIALLRSVVGLRTAGLFFRSGECFRPGWKYRVKYVLFRLAALLPRVEIVTIVPFDVEPRFARVATGFIYDPQLWDLPFLAPPATDVSAPLRDVRAQAGARKILVALGGQNRIKGFERLVDLWCARADLRERVLFVVAGEVAPACGGQAAAFTAAGGLLLGGYASNDLILGLYQVADLVWCCYAPDYDQSSGIFGRAVQFGVPVVVRRDALLERLAASLRHPALAISFDNDAEAAVTLLRGALARPPADVAACVEAMRERSRRTLLACVGLPNAGA